MAFSAAMPHWMKGGAKADSAAGWMVKKGDERGSGSRGGNRSGSRADLETLAVLLHGAGA